MGITAAIGTAVGGVASSAIGAGAASSAANTQAQAAQNAQNISQGEFNTITQQEQPFMQGGYGALSSLQQGLGTVPSNGSAGYGSLASPFTLSDFQQMSPAYQFQLQQGQNGVLNADSSSQGALSGAAMKDLTSFNQNYANTSFNNAFNQFQTQQGNIYSRLAGLATLGQNAASNTGAQGTALAGQAAQSAQNIGTAQAAGTIGVGNALSSGVSNLSALPYLMNNGSANAGNWNGGTPFANSNGTLNYDPGAGVASLGVG